jgi:MFS family permease
LNFIPDFRGLPRDFWVLFAGTLVNRTGGFVLVFLAIYLTEIRGLTPGQAGAIISAYGIGAICGGPFGGALSDRIGRKPTLVWSLVAGGGSMLVLGLVMRPAAIAAAAVATGLLYEMYRPVVSAAIADLVEPNDRPRAYSLIYWAVNLGASIAPILGGVVAARSYRVLFAADAATTALYGVILAVALRETRVVHQRSDEDGRAAWATVLADRPFLIVCVLTFVISVVFFQSFVGLPIDVRAHGISAAGFGGLIALNGVLIVLFQPFATQLIEGRDRVSVLAWASLLMGIGFGMTAWIGSVLGYAVSVAIWTIGEILFAPASTTLVANMAPADLRGRYQGLFSVAFTGAFAAAPAIGGSMISGLGARTLWIGCLVTGAIVTGGFLAIRPAVSRR